MTRYVQNTFTLATKSTIGADFLSKQIVVDDQAVTLQIWDTAGQERFQGGMSRGFYRGTDCVVLVFDVSRKSTFDSLLAWRKSFLIQSGREVSDDFLILVIANKVDRNDRAITTDMVAQFCREHNMSFFECSAKECINVEKAFEELAKKALKQIEPDKRSWEPVVITEYEEEEPGVCCLLYKAQVGNIKAYFIFLLLFMES
eukprot:TRINITY_DN4409_c0_g1_i2.p1 TRINITY_DN4409_c0_g1~~TRINITY_DN4409_c0_g1_i2.p1  ORF type:complete len:201 (+),score=35.54 TRINITY_DN4409_c0_g1_i2:136-738(+)